MILIGFNVCSGYAKVTLYVLNNAFWGCGGCNLQILCVHHACITHWAFLGSKTSDSICSESKRVWEDEDWFPQKKNSKYPAEPRLKNKYCKTTLSIITISYRHYSHTTPEASSEETNAIKKKFCHGLLTFMVSICMIFFLLWNTKDDILTLFFCHIMKYKSMKYKSTLYPTDFHCTETFFKLPTFVFGTA